MENRWEECPGEPARGRKLKVQTGQSGAPFPWNCLWVNVRASRDLTVSPHLGSHFLKALPIALK